MDFWVCYPDKNGSLTVTGPAEDNPLTIYGGVHNKDKPG